MAHRDYFWDRSGRRIKRAPKVIPTPALTHGGGGVFGGTGTTPPPSGSDSFWERAVATSTTVGFVRTKSSRVDTGDDSIQGAYLGQFEYDAGGGDVYRAYLQITPGSNGPGHSIFDGQDIQASAWMEGTDNTMDWYFWSRPSSGGTEAGTFFDAIGDDGAGGNPEAYFQPYADARVATIETFADSDAGASAEFDVTAYTDNPDTHDAVAEFFFGAKNGFLRFAKFGGDILNVAPDGNLRTGDWSIGWDGTNFVFKVNDGGIKTWTATPT